MKTSKLDSFTNGWIVGAFHPTLLANPDVEVGIHYYKKDEPAPSHYHLKAVEINVVVSGKMLEQGMTMNPGDIFVLDIGEKSDTIFLEDTVIVVIKTPSEPGDKYLA